MKTSSCLSSSYRALALAAAALGGLAPARSSWDNVFQKANSSIIVQTVAGSTGKIVTVRAFETGQRLYVAGQARTMLFGPAAHVDIELIGRHGEVIVRAADDLNRAHLRTVRGRNGQSSFIVSFPLNETRDASRVRVTHHGASHS